MVQIAICDDEQAQVANTSDLLQAYAAEHPGFHYHLTVFSQMNPLLFAIADGVHFDILFLDIYMQGITGVEGATQLRKDHFAGQIIFQSSSREHTFDAFAVNATQYLIKPLQKEQFFATMQKALHTAQRLQRASIALTISGVLQKIPLHHIMFAQTSGNYQHIQMEDGQVLVARITATQLFALLAGHRSFLPVGKAYIVNLEFVEQLSAKELILTDGTVVHLPRGTFGGIKKAYFSFLSQEGV